MASASWCKETDEKINYTKLCRLLVDGGTQAVRSVFDGIHPPSSLKAILNANQTTLQRLKKPRGKVLNNEQWDKLYPPSGSNPTSEDFDITLLFVLLKNICGLTPPATGWDVLPPVTDTSLEANLARIKYYRNNTIAHKPNTAINDAVFKQHWQDISSALLSLGLSQDDIDDLKSSPLGEKDYDQLLSDWYNSDKDIKMQLEDVKSNTSLIPCIQEDISQLKSFYSSTNIRDSRINQLANSDFSSLIESLCKSFHPNTRRWVLDEVKSHVDSDQPDSCIMLITAGPGMGKSIIAAKVCQTYEDLGCLAGCHFFQFSNSTRNNPRLMLQSIARQMCDTVPGYREALESKLQTDLGKKITEMTCEELLTVLLEEPLQKLKGNKQFVVVLDAIDECTSDLKHELLHVLKSKLSLLPGWLRFVIATRPNVFKLEKYLDIDPGNPQNRLDLELFFAFELKKIHGDSDPDHNVVDLLVRMSKGIFLVAFFLTDYLKKHKVESPKELLELFPNGISSVCENYFSRLKEEILPYISEEGFYKMLEAVVASEMPLPKNMFYNILDLKSERDIPRTKKRARQDALNYLHSLFPVMYDHVTAFHKSVFDWLILQEDEKHDFSVLAEDGNEVLADECYDVLSDIRNGKKDLDKPLNVTDSEKYALRFLRHLVEGPSSFFKADKYEFYSNIYVLTALVIVTKPLFYLPVYDGESVPLYSFISRTLCKILHETYCFPTYYMFDCHSCPHVCCCLSTFGQYLALVLQAAHAEGLSNETTPNPFDALKKFHFPYCNEKSLFQTPFVAMGGDFSLHCLLKCKNGFIAVVPTPCSNSLSTAVYMFQLDGSLITQKSFPGQRLVTTSPNIDFIVVAEGIGNKIKILDVTTLEVVSQYESPHDAIETCHVFRDDQGCFIVIKGCDDNKVYVIEGLTGQVRNTITVTQGSYVRNVSSQGHIVVTRTWEGQKTERKTFTNKDGEVELMNWVNLDFIRKKKEAFVEYRELLLYRYERKRVPIPIYPQTEKICCCAHAEIGDIVRNVTVLFSEDGRLLAYRYKDSIFIVNTSDGSLFRRCLIVTRTLDLDILFVSDSYLVIIDEPNLVIGESVMFVINVQTNAIEHRIYLPRHVHPYQHKIPYLLFPEEGGKSFTLIRHLQKPNSYEVSSLEFHNLNLQGL